MMLAALSLDFVLCGFFESASTRKCQIYEFYENQPRTLSNDLCIVYCGMNLNPILYSPRQFSAMSRVFALRTKYLRLPKHTHTNIYDVMHRVVYDMVIHVAWQSV